MPTLTARSRSLSVDLGAFSVRYRRQKVHIAGGIVGGADNGDVGQEAYLKLVFLFDTIMQFLGHPTFLLDKMSNLRLQRAQTGFNLFRLKTRVVKLLL